VSSKSLKDFVLRSAVVEDAAALQDCMIAAYSVYLETMRGISFPPLEVDYASEFVDYPTWVAELDGLVAVGLIMTFSSGVASIANIAVHPAAQGSGVGRVLLELAERQAREEGCSRMRLATHILLKQNVSLYQHFGWEVVDQDSLRTYMEKRLV